MPSSVFSGHPVYYTTYKLFLLFLFYFVVFFINMCIFYFFFQSSTSPYVYTNFTKEEIKTLKDSLYLQALNSGYEKLYIFNFFFFNWNIGQFFLIKGFGKYKELLHKTEKFWLAVYCFMHTSNFFNILAFYLICIKQSNLVYN